MATAVTDVRRQFELPALDREFLDRRLPWEALIEKAGRWVILHEYSVPGGYDYAIVSVALQLPESYPDTQIDMAYFYPHLARTTERVIGGSRRKRSMERHGNAGRGIAPLPIRGVAATTA